MLLYGSETWTIKARDARRIKATGIKYMRRTAGYIWTDYKTNAPIAKELKLTPILDNLIAVNKYINISTYNSKFKAKLPQYFFPH